MTSPVTPTEQGDARKPSMEPWQTLLCEDGAALVIPDDHTDKMFALIELMRQEYGGDWSDDNPVLVEALKDCRIEVWHSYTKADHDNAMTEYVGRGNYYGTDGSGKRHVTVLWYLSATWHLGERAEAVEPKAAVS